MMNNLKTIFSSSQSVAKLVAILCIALQSHGADIFSQPAKVEELSFPTTRAILDATRSGDIPNALANYDDIDKQVRYRDGLGKSVAAIIQQQHLVPTDVMRSDIASSIGWMLQYISEFELSGGKNERRAEIFQSFWQNFCDRHTKDNPKLRDEVDSILKTYSQAVKESLILKKERDDRRAAESEKGQRQADAAIQQMNDAAAQKRAAADAEAARERAVDTVRATAIQKAMQAQAEVKRKKLAETLASPAYNLWEASVQVEEGVRLIVDGQQLLTRQTEIERESGVIDLTARRAAGERVAAGKLLVRQAFETYRQLGGKALTPEEVKAGPDPAAEYR